MEEEQRWPPLEEQRKDGRGSRKEEEKRKHQSREDSCFCLLFVSPGSSGHRRISFLDSFQQQMDASLLAW